MAVIDLTHTIETKMTVYPGTPEVKLTKKFTVEKNGFAETMLNIMSHVGTHMDAPAHIFTKGNTLDELHPAAFMGKGCVVDCRGADFITMPYIKKAGKLAEKAEFILFYTGWERRWGYIDYFEGYPLFDEEVMRWCAESKKGVGTDAISIDAVDDPDMPMHNIILGADMVIIENLAELEELIGKEFFFMALPLKYKDADGAPVRAVAIVGE